MWIVYSPAAAGRGRPSPTSSRTRRTVAKVEGPGELIVVVFTSRPAKLRAAGRGGRSGFRNWGFFGGFIAGFRFGFAGLTRSRSGFKTFLGRRFDLRLGLRLRFRLGLGRRFGGGFRRFFDRRFDRRVGRSS